MTLESNLPLPLLFIILFTLAGPIKMIPVFHVIALQLDPGRRNGFAVKAALIAFGGVVLASLTGAMQIQKVGISGGALAIAAGLVLAIVGLRPLIGLEEKTRSSGKLEPLSFAFPTILPPHAFGLIILFSLYASSTADTVAIILVGGALMLLNLIGMLGSRWVMGTIGATPLRVFGAVFGIMQLALGIQILFWGLLQELLRTSI